MTEFDAFYYDEKFYINGTKEYTLGSILEKYLSRSSRAQRTNCRVVRSIYGFFAIPKLADR